MSDKNYRLKRIEQLLNGPPTSDELYASAHVCERLATLIEKGGADDLFRPERLRDNASILRDFGSTSEMVEESKKRRKLTNCNQ